MGPHGNHPRVMREVPKELAKPLSINNQQSWLTGKVLGHGNLANVTPIYKKDWKDDWGKYRPVSLISVLGKVMEKIILSLIKQHVQNDQGIKPSQHGFMKDKSCLTSLVFYEKVICVVDEGKAVDMAQLDFSKAFDTISNSVFPEKLVADNLDE